jgi:copper(I)-binding protein
MKCLFSIGTVVLLTGLAWSTSAWAGDLVARDAWIRQPPPGNNAAGYLVIANRGGAKLRVTGVATDVAARAELHRSWVEDGVAHMRRVDGVEVPAGGEAVLEPGGLHVMLIRPSRLEIGQKVELRFEVEGQDELVVEAEVRRGAPDDASNGHDGHDGHEGHDGH